MGELDPELDIELAEIALGRRDGQPILITFDLYEGVTAAELSATGVKVLDIEDAGQPQADFEPFRHATALATPSALSRLAALDGVGWIDRPEEIEDELIFSRKACHVPNQITNDTPPKFIDKVTGVGTVLGVIDGSIDVFHSAFRNKDGTTRIRALWVQNMAPFYVRRGRRPRRKKVRQLIPPTTPRLGCYFDAAIINFALGFGTPPSGFEERDRDSLRFRLYKTAGFSKGGLRRSDHGSHVAGIAAGNGRRLVGNPVRREIGDFIGVAPQANVVGVTAHGRVDIAAGVKLFHSVAEQFGTPAAINVSLGRSRGPHVVGWPATRRVAQAVRKEQGTTTVMSAGNYGSKRGHVGGKILPNQTRTIEMRISPKRWRKRKGLRSITVELWGGYKSGGEFEFHLIHPVSGRRIPIKPNKKIDRLKKPRQPFFAKALHMKGTPSLHGIRLTLPRRGITSRTWKLEIKCTQAPVSGTDWHAWIAIPAMKKRVARLVGATNETTMNAVVPAATLSVGALEYDVLALKPKNFRVAKFSSRGPLPDGLAFPTLVAPGNEPLVRIEAPVIPNSRKGISAKKGWDTFGDKGGTSMAAPHVAGTVALLKQLHAGFDQETIKKILVGSATKKPAGGSEHEWGAGSLNVEESLDLATLFIPE